MMLLVLGVRRGPGSLPVGISSFWHDRVQSERQVRGTICLVRNGMGGGERFGLGGSVDGREKLWEVADVRRGIDGYWREDEIYGAHTLLGGDEKGDYDGRDGGNGESEGVKRRGERRQ
jgi:hypothetical protein